MDFLGRTNVEKGLEILKAAGIGLSWVKVCMMLCFTEKVNLVEYALHRIKVRVPWSFFSGNSVQPS
jgi:hypothetical protein